LKELVRRFPIHFPFDSIFRLTDFHSAL